MSIIRKIAGRLKRGMNDWAAKTVWFNDTLQFAGCKRILSNQEFNLEVANLGSTTGYYAFNYAGIGVKGLNLATPRQTLMIDRELLKNYFSHLKEGAVVLIPLCVFSSLIGEDSEMPDKYYVLLHNDSIPHFSWKKKLQVLNFYNNPLRYLPMVTFPFEIIHSLKKRRQTMTTEQLKTDAIKWMNDWKHEFSIVDFKRGLSLRNKDSYESATTILRDIIDFCISRNLKPVIVFPPVSKYLSNSIDEDMRKLLITDFVNRANEGKAPFLNYMDDHQFADDNNYQNAYFLNVKGSLDFTKRLFVDLREMGYLS